MNKLFLFFFFIVACSSAPIKEFKTIQYLPLNGACFERLLDDDTIETICYDDVLEKGWIVITKEHHNKELDYQDLLIRQCKKWR